MCQELLFECLIRLVMLTVVEDDIVEADVLREIDELVGPDGVDDVGVRANSLKVLAELHRVLTVLELCEVTEV